MENWKEIARTSSKTHAKVYEVSDLGNVRTRNYNHLEQSIKGRWKILNLQRGGSDRQYLKVQLGTAIGYKYIHRLVLEAFICACPEGSNANHKDLDTFNNRLDNLEWITFSKNSQHMQDLYGGVNQHTKHTRRVYT